MPEERSPAGLLVLMVLMVVWSAALAVGFVAVVVVGELSVMRAVVYLVLAGFLGVLASATGRELVRRLRSRS